MSEEVPMTTVRIKGALYEQVDALRGGEDFQDYTRYLVGIAATMKELERKNGTSASPPTVRRGEPLNEEYPEDREEDSDEDEGGDEVEHVMEIIPITTREGKLNARGREWADQLGDVLDNRGDEVIEPPGRYQRMNNPTTCFFARTMQIDGWQQIHQEGRFFTLKCGRTGRPQSLSVSEAYAPILHELYRRYVRGK